MKKPRLGIMTNGHQIELKYYFDTFILPDLQLADSFGMARKTLTVRMEELKLGHSTETSFMEWITQSKYLCVMCDQVSFKYLPTFERHIMKWHGMTKSEYIDKFDTLYGEERKFHQCKIIKKDGEMCRKSVTLKKDNLRAHLYHIHFKAMPKHQQLTPKSYFSKYVMKKTFTLKELQDMDVI